MPEIRQNIATREWVIIATERAKRPEDFKPASSQSHTPLPPYVAKCPFCPGNEDQTPPELFSIKTQEGKWQVRVVPNKFAALSSEGEPIYQQRGSSGVISGVGSHEVIIESPLHNITTALLSYSDIEKILTAYKVRYQALEEDPRIAHIIIFKNHGASAGTSLEHPHSQIVGTPIVPVQVRHRMEDAMTYHDNTGRCVYCKMIEEEIAEKSRIIKESKHFVTFIPFAACSPFHTWLLPKRHMASFSAITEEELKDLAVILKSLLAKVYIGLNNPDYNYVIRSANKEMGHVKYFHWYISLIPIVTKMAGFELGTGMFINVALPEKSAEFLRNINEEEI